ncbi:SET domain-containing protein [Cylindrobasidium torrendii FP15055 ss-10]|uniref:SET domain-containing protein n=1 Tax=Cylindrobasidium torrendii FP15055 ss-10 TaxID=1314674 RepID=A0A0D7BVM5_9AGAR|nr:SET domain-containing protein [Cylindrobasidium torrendii FP15055 ss-10]
MRRGFLLDGKAKPKGAAPPPAARLKPTPLEVDTNAKASQATSVPTPLKAMDRGSDREYSVMPSGVIENAGRPDGYITGKFTIHEDTPGVDVPDAEFMFTSMPPGAPDAVSCIMTGWLKRHLLSQPGFPKPMDIPEKPAYRIDNIPGKGKGMIATRKIKVGDVVSTERPLKVDPAAIPIPLDFPAHFSDMQMHQAFLYEKGVITEKIVKRMQPERQAAYMSLANTHLHDGSSPIMGITRTNAFGLENMCEKDGAANDRASWYSGVWDHQSRINHSCSPNVVRTWDTASFSQQMRASRDIEEGEEITVTYTNLTWTYERRKGDLKPYEVDCDCKSCSQVDHTRSDKRRTSFANPPPLRPPMGPVPSGTAPDAWIAPALKMIRLMEAEGLECIPQYPKVLHQIVNAYAFMADERALIYARKLYQAKRVRMEESSSNGFYEKLCELDTLKQTLGMAWGLMRLAARGPPGMVMPMVFCG